MKFRVKKGIHKEGTNVFKEGEVFESNTDHVKVNGHEKFEQVSSTAKLSPKGDAETKMSAFIPVQTAVENGDSEEAKATAAAKAAAEANEMEESDEEIEEGDGEEKEEGELGVNVTSQFPIAEEADLLVFKKGKEFFVTESDEPNKSINEAHLKSKPQVEKFLKSQVKK